MKSIFKKIAFVLALAMVVTAFPAQTAAAASGPQLKAHRVLYIGGDVTETYAEKAYATVWNFKEDGYKVQFESSNPEVATVGKNKGMVTAVSVGKATVTATFTKKGAKDVVKECKVEVKKNAAAVTIDEESEKAIQELKVGEKPAVFPVVGQVLLWIVKGIGCGIKYLFVGLGWIICLPFKGIAAIIRKIKSGKDGET